MKRRFIIIISFWFLIFSTPIWAETLYVTEVEKINMRTGQSHSHRILDIIKSGEKVEVLEDGEGWTRVRLTDGKEGWVLTRYLTTQEPIKPILNDLKIKYQSLLKKFNALNKENETLKSENHNIRSELKDKEKLLKQTKKSYEDLKTGSSKYLSVKGQLEESNKELADLRITSKKLRETVEKLRTNQIIKGLLIGAGILLLGFIIGLSSRRQRRRSSLL